MKLTRRAFVNLVVIGALSVFALGWATVNLAKVHPFEHRKTVRVRLASTGGALPGSEVTYLGVPIGKVTSAHLVPGAVEVAGSVHPKGPMARTLRADVRQKSSLGEPYIDLSPADPAHPDIGDPNGAVIPIERTSTPRPLYALFDRMDQLMSQVQPADLAKLSDGFSGLVGHEQDLQAMIHGFADSGQVLAKDHQQLGQLLGDSARLTTTLDAARADLDHAISGAAGIGQVLGQRTAQLDGILRNGDRLARVGNDLLTKSEPALDATLLGLDTTFHNLAVRPTKVTETVEWMPRFLQRFSYIMEGDMLNVGVGTALVPIFPGYQPRMDIPPYGQGMRLDKIIIPSLAQRVDVDLQGNRSGRTLAYLSPAELRYALQGEQQLEQMIAEKTAEVNSGHYDPNP